MVSVYPTFSSRSPPESPLLKRRLATASRESSPKGYDRGRLPQFDRIPSSKLPIVKFGLAGRSVAVLTESLGVQRHRGHVARLVNEHSASAAEMVAALRVRIGNARRDDRGRLVATSAFKVGFGYRIVMPLATYLTWHGTNLEGRGWRRPSKSSFHF